MIFKIDTEIELTFKEVLDELFHITTITDIFDSWPSEEGKNRLIVEIKNEI